MDNPPEVNPQQEIIRQQMEETRSSLQDKLEVLEQQVMSTVKDANQTVEAVMETVESVKDSVVETVETVKDTVQGTVDTVKDTMQETVASVKDAFDLPRQVEAHPWAMFAGATAVGFLGGKILLRLTAPARPAQLQTTPSYAPPAPALYRETTNGIAAAAPEAPAPEPSFWSTIADRSGAEIDKLKGLAVSALGGVGRELVPTSVPPGLKDGITDIVDSVTTKLGGHPLEEPILNYERNEPGPTRAAS